MRTIRVMAEYGSRPIWWSGEEAGDGDLDPNSLPLSKELKQDLFRWAQRLDEALNWDDPANTIWPPGFWAGCNRMGKALFFRVRAELAGSYSVEWL